MANHFNIQLSDGDIVPIKNPRKGIWYIWDENYSVSFLISKNVVKPPGKVSRSREEIIEYIKELQENEVKRATRYQEKDIIPENRIESIEDFLNKYIVYTGKRHIHPGDLPSATAVTKRVILIPINRN